MKIRTGELFQEVIFEGDIKGEGLVICLSQDDPTVATRWLVQVYVHLAQGWWFLGYLRTNTAAVDGAAARVVGFASCPGARGWKINVHEDSTPAAPSTNTGLDAEWTLQAGLCCGGGSPYGVFMPPTPGSGRVPTDTGESGGDA